MQPLVVFMYFHQPEGVQRRVHVPGVVRAAVCVVVIERKEINIMENEAVIMVQLEGLHKANVKQLSSIESCFGGLFYNHNPGEGILVTIFLNLVRSTVKLPSLAK